MKHASVVIAICGLFIACRDAVVEPQPSEVMRPALAPAGTDVALADLGTLGGCCSMAYSINNAGQVVGESKTADDLPHAFLWQSGTMVNLGTLGGTWSRATGINNAGQVVGESHTASGAVHPFLWANGVMTDLGTLGDGSGSAQAINDLAQVVGISNGEGFLWENGTLVPLGTSQFGSLNAINLAAQVVGHLLHGPFIHAGLWQAGVVTDLGTLGGCCSGALDVNNAGTIVGWAAAPGDLAHAVLWRDGRAEELGVIGGAIAINESGQVVGSTIDYRAFLWNHGSLSELDGLAGYPKTYARGINDDRQIVGGSCTEQWEVCHAVLWTLATPSGEASAGGPYTGVEGALVSFNGSGPSGTTSFLWDFGDGSVAGTGATPSHIYADNGVYNVTLTVSDGTTSSTATTSATIANVAPLATFRAARSLDTTEPADTVNEGTAIKLGFFNPTDPSPVDVTAGFQYAYDCGAGYGAFTKKTRTYCPTVDQELRAVRAKIRDKDGGETEYSQLVPVVNHKPHVELTTAQGPTSPLGSSRTVSGTFRDPGVQDAPWGWVVVWGDGITTSGVTSTQPGPITASHVYTRLGTFRVKMFVTDKDGGTGKSNSLYVQVMRP